MQSMHHVEAAPLIYAQRSEKGMHRYPLHAELAPASIEQLVHGGDFLAHEIAQLLPVHSRKTAGNGHRLIQRRHSPGKFSKAEDHQLQQPLQIGAFSVAGKPAFVQPGL
jgi:hypothetical protein